MSNNRLRPLKPALNRWSALSLALLMLAALLLGYLQSADGDNPRRLLSWSNSSWITTPMPSASGYFRATVELPVDVDRAVLQIAATDRYTLFVNGHRVAAQQRKSLATGAVYDVSPLLHGGDNIIAAEVHLSSYPAAPGLRFELTTIDRIGRLAHTGSDLFDRVTALQPEAQGVLQWSEPGYDDRLWPRPQLWRLPVEPTRIGFDPDLLLNLPTPSPKRLLAPGSWQVNASLSLPFRRDSLGDRHNPGQVWLGFSSDAPFEISINDRSLGLFSASPTQLRLLPVASRLREGDNRINVTFMAGGGSVLAAGGLFVDRRSGLQAFPLGPNWQVSGDVVGNSGALAELQGAASQHAASTTEASAPTPPYLPDQQFVPPRVFQLAPWLAAAQYAAGLLILLIAAGYFGLSAVEVINRGALANWLVLLLGLCMLLLAQDIRFDARILFNGAGQQLLFLLWLVSTIGLLLPTSPLSADNRVPCDV